MEISIDEKWLFVSRCLQDMQKQNDRLMDAIEGLMISPESPLIEPMGFVEDRLLQALSVIVNDEFETFSWFVYECDYGRDPKEAGCKNNMKLIDTQERLRWLIELDCDTQS